jgi:hypothetical protein
MVTVYGQKGDGPIMVRRVFLGVFLLAWGRFAPSILNARKDTPVVYGDRKVWTDEVELNVSETS